MVRAAAGSRGSFGRDSAAPDLRDCGRTKAGRGETKANHCATLSLSLLAPARVSLEDSNGVEHAVEVLADSLYEAAAWGLSLLSKNAWTDQKPGPLTRLRVEVREPAVV